MDAVQHTVVSSTTRAMDAQLSQLGGSDLARVGTGSVWVRVAPAAPEAPGAPEPETVVGVDEGHVVVRDPREPVDAPSSQNYRRFRVSGTFGADASQGDVHETIGVPAVDWLLDGFNSTLVAFGEVGTGKTHSLFGGAGGERSWQDQGLCGNVISQLFERVEAAPSEFVVGISAWEILNNDTFDLLAYPVEPNPSTQPTFTNVRTNSRAAALKVLERARAGSQNWTHGGAHDSEPFVSLPNSAHAFVRLTLVNVQKRRCSTVHLVDLAGSQSLDRRHSPRAFQITAENAKERKNINQQLLAFSRVVQEMSQANEGRGDSVASEVKLISMRDSRLTQVLGPVMAENSRTVFLATVDGRQEHYNDTVQTLRTATRAMHVACPCVPTTLLASAEAATRAAAGAEMQEVLSEAAKLVPLQQVLSVRMINEIAHLDPSLSGVDGVSLATSAAPTSGTGYSASASSDPPPSSDAGSSTTGEASSLGEQVRTLRNYMSKNFPAAANGAEPARPQGEESLEPSVDSAAVDADQDGSRGSEHDQGQTQSPVAKKRRTPARENPPPRQFQAADTSQASRQFQREFEQVCQEMEQAEATAREIGLGGAGSGNLRDEIQSNLGNLRESLQRETQQPQQAWQTQSQYAPKPRSPQPAAGAASAETDTLRLNYESLLSVLREVEQEKARLENQVVELQHEHAELEVQHELALDTKQVELIELQAKLRKATGSAGYGEVFEMFEGQIELLQKEAQVLREENLAKERELQMGKGGGSPDDRADDSTESGGVPPRYSARSAALGQRAEMVTRQMQQELQQLRKENTELKKKERKFALHQKGFEDASRKVEKLKKELGAREAQLRSESVVIEEYERRLREMGALMDDANGREEQLHSGYHAAFRENEELKMRMRKMRADLGSQTHARARSAYSKVASAAGLNVFEHCKRLERDLPSSSRCLANFQRVLKAIDKQDRELVSALDREQELLDLIRDYESKAREQLRQVCTVHQKVFARPPSQRVLAELAAANGQTVEGRV